MKVAALITASYEPEHSSERFLEQLNDKTVIWRTVESLRDTGLLQSITVVTDSDRIVNEVKSHGGNAVRSAKKYTDHFLWFAEEAKSIDADFIICVKGAQPFMDKVGLENLIAMLENDDMYRADITSLAQSFGRGESLEDEKRVKVALTLPGFGLYFSRLPIPRKPDRPMEMEPDYSEHIEVYGFRKATLLRIPDLQRSLLEEVEKVPCLRFLENILSIRLATTTNKFNGLYDYDDIRRADDIARYRDRDWGR